MPAINATLGHQGLPSINAETKAHKTAQSFVGSFFTQMVKEMFKESSEDNFEMDMANSFMADAMGEKIADSTSSKDMVTLIENKLRQQQGLPKINTYLQQTHKPQENAHVWSTTA